MGGEGRDVTWMYRALGHPHRKRIIELIGKREKSGFKELREELQVSVGALYHHLETLDRLIAQDDQRKYILTERGRLAYELLEVGGERLSSLSLTEAQKPRGACSSALASLQRILLPGSLFIHVSNQPVQCTPIAAAVIAFGAWAAAQAGLQFTLLFPTTLSKAPPPLTAASFVTSWLILFALCDLLATLLFKRRDGDLALLVGSALSLLPLILFSCAWSLARALRLALTTLEAALLLLPLQAWTIAMMSAAIALSKGLRVDKAALISFMAAYVNLAYIMLTQAF